MGKKKVTMEDIGNRLNISKYAVSLALSGKKGVSESTRERVIQVAKEMNYKPLPTHKALYNRINKRGNIGIITSVQVLNNPQFFSVVLNEIEKEVRNRGYGLNIASVDKDSQLPSFVEKNTVDGIIVISNIGRSLMEEIKKSDIPCVVVEHNERYMDIDSIITNNKQGVYLAIEYLDTQLSSPTIGFIGNTAESASHKERWVGFRETADNLQLDVNMDYCKIDGFSKSPQDPVQDIGEFLDGLDELPDAFFCANDLLAVILSGMLIKRGVKIPEDISIIGFDDTRLTKYNIPPLTMVRLYREYYASRAVGQLFARIKHKRKPFETIRINTRLVIRNSVRNVKDF